VATVVLEHVTVDRGGARLLDDVNLAIADGEVVGVVGASGAGSSTLLRAIAGVDPLSAGVIRIDGHDVSDAPSAARNVSMVFQTPQLLAHRDVRHNIAFPLELRHQAVGEIADRVGAESRALHIEALLARSPRELSTGERQLVQIARALVRMPSLLLLDEPLASLDATLSQQMRTELRVLQRGYGVTTLLATKDPIEAMSLSDRLVVLAGGRVTQVDTPLNVYTRPVSLVAAACTGHVSTVSAVVQGEVERDGHGFWLTHPACRLRAWQPSLQQRIGTNVLVGFRPSMLRIASDGALSGTVAAANPVAGTVTVALGGDEVEVSAARRWFRRGDQVSMHADDVMIFDPGTGARLD
jgi:ABC-type sugar transport system ATPase subunit